MLAYAALSDTWRQNLTLRFPALWFTCRNGHQSVVECIPEVPKDDYVTGLAKLYLTVGNATNLIGYRGGFGHKRVFRSNRV